MLDPLTKGYLTLHPAAAARTLARLDSHDAVALFEAMPRQLGADVLQHMVPRSASRCLGQLSTKTAAELLGRMPAVFAAAALRQMKRDRVKALLAPVPRPTAAMLWLRLRYSETVVGTFVDEDVVTLSPEHRVVDAFRLLRRAGKRTGQTVPVLDEGRQLAGVVSLTDLLSARDRSLVRRVMHPAIVVFNARAPVQTATNHPAWLTHDSLPVTNRDGVFQGVIWRSEVTEQEQRLQTEVAGPNALAATRAALADIFWMGLGALFIGETGSVTGKRKEE